MNSFFKNSEFSCSGQIADGLSTLFVGFFMDAGDNFWLCNRYGKRKSWHLVGTLCVLAAFPFIFMPCIGLVTTAIFPLKSIQTKKDPPFKSFLTANVLAG